MFTGLRVWRAFPELRGYSDAECRRLLAAASVRFDVSPAPAWFAAALGALAGAAIVAAIGNARADADRLMRGDLLAGAVVLFVWLAVPAGAAAAAWVLTRALQARLALRRLLRVASCPRCGYTLEGLRLIDPPGLDPNPAQRRVRCPECGKSWTVLELGLSPVDLLAWQARVVSKDMGRMRKRPAVPLDQDDDE